MSVDIDNLLSLPQKERRKIAEKLWSSLSPTHSFYKTTVEEKKILTDRIKKVKTGKAKFIPAEETHKILQQYLASKK
jgi:putative addiction module component (TIGR02574 family)